MQAHLCERLSIVDDSRFQELPPKRRTILPARPQLSSILNSNSIHVCSRQGGNRVSNRRREAEQESCGTWLRSCDYPSLSENLPKNWLNTLDREDWRSSAVIKRGFAAPNQGPPVGSLEIQVQEHYWAGTGSLARQRIYLSPEVLKAVHRGAFQPRAFALRCLCKQSEAPFVQTVRGFQYLQTGPPGRWHPRPP